MSEQSINIVGMDGSTLLDTTTTFDNMEEASAFAKGAAFMIGNNKVDNIYVTDSNGHHTQMLVSGKWDGFVTVESEIVE